MAGLPDNQRSRQPSLFLYRFLLFYADKPQDVIGLLMPRVQSISNLIANDFRDKEESFLSPDKFTYLAVKEAQDFLLDALQNRGRLT